MSQHPAEPACTKATGTDSQMRIKSWMSQEVESNRLTWDQVTVLLGELQSTLCPPTIRKQDHPCLELNNAALDLAREHLDEHTLKSDLLGQLSIEPDPLAQYLSSSIFRFFSSLKRYSWDDHIRGRMMRYWCVIILAIWFTSNMNKATANRRAPRVGGTNRRNKS